MWKYNNPDELYHYGILGMKWGRRKARTRVSDDAREYKRLKKRKIKTLSNQELKRVNERSNLERQYKQNNPGAMKKVAIGVAATAATLGTLNSIKKNGGSIIRSGRHAYKHIMDWANS